MNNLDSTEKRVSYTDPIYITYNKAPLYLNEIFFAGTSQFRANKQVYAKIAGPSLYDLAQKILLNKGKDIHTQKYIK